MKKLIKDIVPAPTRRSFMLGMMVTGVGVVMSSAYSQVTPFEPVDSLSNHSFSPSTEIKIDPDGTITLTIAKSEMGQGIRTSFAMILAEELDADWTKVIVRHARPDDMKANEHIDTTGGSNSILLKYDHLRKVGATARAILIAAAAQQWNISPENCVSKNSSISEINGTRTVSYGELTELASIQGIPSNPPLKSSTDFSIIGTRKAHIDTADIVSGKAIYGLDVRVPNMKYALYINPPAFGAFIVSIDTSQALKVAGVLKVEFVPDLGYVVLAENTYSAIKGREALIIQWNTDKHATLDSAEISRQLQTKISTLPTLPDGTFSTIEAQYELPYLAHATMEPMNCLADVRDNRAEIWCGTQVVDYVRSESAKRLGMPIESVIVNVPLLGGGFGRRLYIDIAIAAVLISKAFKMPVLFMLTRYDDFRIDYYRPASYHLCKGGLDASGNITDIIHYTVNGDNSGMPPYQISPPTTSNELINFPLPVGAWRSVGHTSSIFAYECFIDELAFAAKKDPFEFRRAMLPVDSRLRIVLEKAAELANWNSPMPAGRGRGIACYSWSSDVAHVVEVTVSSKGQIKVDRVIAVIDCGIVINPMGVEAQMQGAVVDALSTALKSEITIDKGGIVQQTFADFGWLTINEMPKIEVHIMPGTRQPLGVGEMGFPSVTPALCNAIFQATGKRVRKLPIQKTEISSVESNPQTDFNDLNINVFPNPITTFCTISGSVQTPLTEVSISIENILGSTIVKLNSPLSDTGQFEEIIEFPLSPAGVYFLTVTCGESRSVHSIIKT
ncbi:MAG: molybdopterin-dependent oxidoreductase [Ignavibacteria bacterium]|nr:molybdopterin-dependent oxidoreductase [Ignavibacteria bacterium]